MIDIFNEWFEGTWENKVQAFSYPSKFAMVRLVHKKIQGTESMYYGEQAYNYSVDSPYRQFIVEAIEDNGSIRIKNYDFDKNFHLGFKNLESRPEGLTHKEFCDIMFTFDGDSFQGSLQGCSCYVEWQDQVTYIKNDIFLSKEQYNVVDRGYLVDTDKQVWGGKHGHFKFLKTPL